MATDMIYRKFSDSTIITERLAGPEPSAQEGPHPAVARHSMLRAYGSGQSTGCRLCSAPSRMPALRQLPAGGPALAVTLKAARTAPAPARSAREPRDICKQHVARLLESERREMHTNQGAPWALRRTQPASLTRASARAPGPARGHQRQTYDVHELRARVA